MGDTPGIRAGDVVKLASGGASMTVIRLEADEAECVWFVGPDVKALKFPVVALRKEPPAFWTAGV